MEDKKKGNEKQLSDKSSLVKKGDSKKKLSQTIKNNTSKQNASIIGDKKLSIDTENDEELKSQMDDSEKSVGASTVTSSNSKGEKKSKKPIIIASIAGTVAAVAALCSTVVLLRDNSSIVTYYVDGQKYEIEIDNKTGSIGKYTPTLKGYDFGGWYFDENLTEKIDDEHRFKDDTVIYPKFVPKTCEVEYFANNGSGESAVQSVVFNTTYTIVENDFTKENYVFVGWSEQPDTHYDDESVISVGEEYTLLTEGKKYYAVWKGVEKSITFSASELKVNGESYTFTNETCPYGEKFILPTLEGEITNSLDYEKKFAGYIVNSEVFSAGTEITITEDIQISINWVDKDSLLYFNLNLPNGETAQAISPLSFSNPLEVYKYLNLPQPDELVNYVFKCWNTKIDGTGVSYSAGQVAKFDSEATLYAQWKKTKNTWSVASIPIQHYTGNPIKPNVLVYNENGELISNENYTVVYEKDEDCITTGIHTVKVKYNNEEIELEYEDLMNQN